MIESHEKEIAKVSANKEVYTAIANSSWKKEEDLRCLLYTSAFTEFLIDGHRHSTLTGESLLTAIP